MFWMIVMLVLLIPLASILLDSAVGRALATRLEGRALTGGDGITQERIAMLESEVERLQSEVVRVSEESEFLHRLLTERSESTDPPAIGEGEGSS